MYTRQNIAAYLPLLQTSLAVEAVTGLSQGLSAVFSMQLSVLMWAFSNPRYLVLMSMVSVCYEYIR